MKKFVILSMAVALQCSVAFGATFRYVNTTYQGDTSVEQSCKNYKIEVGSDTPRSLRIFGETFRLDTPISFIKTGPYSWEEHYIVMSDVMFSWMTPRSQYIHSWYDDHGSNGQTVIYGPSAVTTIERHDESEIITLCKSLSGGIQQIRVDDGRLGKRYLFLPTEGQRVAVTHAPPVFINCVDMANVNQDGVVIDDYGSTFKPEDIGYLKIRLIYQTNVPGKEIKLDIKVDAEKIFTFSVDKKSRRGYTYSLPVGAADNAGTIDCEIMLWKPERLAPDSRLEISAGGQNLCSTGIPLRGATIYYPMAIEAVHGSSQDRKMTSKPSLLYSSSPENAYSLPRPSLYFSVGDKVYRMTRWVEVKM